MWSRTLPADVLSHGPPLHKLHKRRTTSISTTTSPLVITPIPAPRSTRPPLDRANDATAAAPNFKAVAAQENATASSLERRRDVLAASWEGVYASERVRIGDTAAAFRQCLLGACGKLQELVEESWRERQDATKHRNDEVRIPRRPSYVPWSLHGVSERSSGHVTG